jgi:hypothetical protein
MKPWVKKGAVCCCQQEGMPGSLWEVIMIDRDRQMVWLEAYGSGVTVNGTVYVPCLGWRPISKCYRTDQSRQAEKTKAP